MCTIQLFLKPFLAQDAQAQDAQEVMLVSESQLADFTDVTLVSEDAAHNSLQMLSSRDDGDDDGDGDNDGERL